MAILLRFPALAADLAQGLAVDLQRFPTLNGMLAADIATLLENPANREIWHRRQRAAEAEIELWVGDLDPALRPQAQQLLSAAAPPQRQYLYRNEAFECIRQLRLTQTRTWIRRLSMQLAAAETDEEREQMAVLLRAIQEYQSLVATPRRSSSFPDMRDTLGHDTE